MDAKQEGGYQTAAEGPLYTTHLSLYCLTRPRGSQHEPLDSGHISSESVGAPPLTTSGRLRHRANAGHEVNAQPAANRVTPHRTIHRVTPHRTIHLSQNWRYIVGIGGRMFEGQPGIWAIHPVSPTLPSQQGGTNFSLPLAQPLAAKHLASIKRAPGVPMVRPGRYVYR